MASSAVGQSCANCYGEGQVPNDDGQVTCPDCGGAGALPTANVLVEWRAGEIERLYGAGGDQIARDVHWLVFELRRARLALTKLLALAEEAGSRGDDAAAGAPDDGAGAAPIQQMRFVANEALGLYPIAPEVAAAPLKPPP